MAAGTMRTAAVALLASLGDGERAAVSTPFDAPDHRLWTYLPGGRPGLPLGELSPEQRRHVLDLVDAGCSERGAVDARAVLWAEAIRRGLEQTAPGSDRDPYDDQRYYVRVLGDPASQDPWAWRINGHHLALHRTVVGDSVTATPQFFGAEPATVLDGPHAGLRTLPVEEDLARELLTALDAGQREAAVFSPVAPRDILTRHDPVADAGRIQRGLSYGDMVDEQRQLLTRLVGQYLGRATAQVALRSWHDITEAGIERLRFTWAGGAEHGQGHYYAVAGPTFLIEYDNTQDDANHIHSVWRDIRHDWGEDLLRAHYAAQRHG